MDVRAAAGGGYSSIGSGGSGTHILCPKCKRDMGGPKLLTTVCARCFAEVSRGFQEAVDEGQQRTSEATWTRDLTDMGRVAKVAKAVLGADAEPGHVASVQEIMAIARHEAAIAMQAVQRGRATRRSPGMAAAWHGGGGNGAVPDAVVGASMVVDDGTGTGAYRYRPGTPVGGTRLQISSSGETVSIYASAEEEAAALAAAEAAADALIEAEKAAALAAAEAAADALIEADLGRRESCPPACPADLGHCGSCSDGAGGDGAGGDGDGRAAPSAARRTSSDAESLPSCSRPSLGACPTISERSRREPDHLGPSLGARPTNGSVRRAVKDIEQSMRAGGDEADGGDDGGAAPPPIAGALPFFDTFKWSKALVDAESSLPMAWEAIGPVDRVEGLRAVFGQRVARAPPPRAKRPPPSPVARPPSIALPTARREEIEHMLAQFATVFEALGARGARRSEREPHTTARELQLAIVMLDPLVLGTRAVSSDEVAAANARLLALVRCLPPPAREWHKAPIDASTEGIPTEIASLSPPLSHSPPLPSPFSLSTEKRASLSRPAQTIGPKPSESEAISVESPLNLPPRPNHQAQTIGRLCATGAGEWSAHECTFLERLAAIEDGRGLRGAEEFVWRMLPLEAVRARLGALHAAHFGLPARVPACASALRELTHACHQVTDAACQGGVLANLLGRVLAFGNHLNARHAEHARAKGFALTSLLELGRYPCPPDVPHGLRGATLLQLLAAHLLLDLRRTLSKRCFPNEAAALATAARAIGASVREELSSVLRLETKDFEVRAQALGLYSELRDLAEQMRVAQRHLAQISAEIHIRADGAQDGAQGSAQDGAQDGASTIEHRYDSERSSQGVERTSQGASAARAPGAARGVSARREDHQVLMSASAADDLLAQLDSELRPEIRKVVLRQLNGAWLGAWLSACSRWVPCVHSLLEESTADNDSDLVGDGGAPLPSSSEIEVAACDALDADAASLKRLVADANAAMAAVADTFGSTFRDGAAHERVDPRMHLEALRAFVPELERALRSVLALPELLRLAKK